MNWWALRRKLHSSWLIAILCVALFLGIILAQLEFSVFFSNFSWLIIGTVLVIFVFLKRRLYLVPVIIVAGVVIGLWRGSVSQSQLDIYKPLYGKMVEVTGRVKDDVDTGSSGQLVMRLDSIRINNRELAGSLWVSTVSRVDIKRGDIVSVRGDLKVGFGSFSGVMYRAKIINITQPVPGDVARVVRDWFVGGIRVGLSDPEASLGIGYLVGQRRALPADLVVALQIAGLTHVVVASGYNLTILVRLARRLFEKVSKYLSALSSVVMIFAFIMVTGLSPSMSRAGLVAGLSLVAWYYGRKFHPIILLAVAIGVTVMVNPSYAWGDLGWQLSFAAFGGVMILAPLIQRYFFGEKKPGFVRQVLGETVSAQICTAPVLVVAFGQLSNVAVVANLLVLPLVPLAMLLTFIAGVGGLAFPAFAMVISAPAQWLLGYMVYVTETLSQIPWALNKITLEPAFAAICYVVIALICLYLWRATKFNLRDTNLVE